MRYHFWQFLINQEGQPINDADISVYVAGTTTPITIYTGELTSQTVSTTPQVKTNSNGYFEFWIGDEEEPIGYTRGTKFKISWNRTGIASGTIDNIEVFQTTEGVDETDADSTFKNKLISNALAYQFDIHSRHDVLEDGYPIHGLMMADITLQDNTFNKIISNKLARNWEVHKDYTFTSITNAPLENSAHNLQPVYVLSTDSQYNKLVSNELMNTIFTQLEQLDLITETIATSAWDYNSGDSTYEYVVIHNFGDRYPSVECWDTDVHEIYYPEKIISVDDNNLMLKEATAKNLYIKVIRR